MPLLATVAALPAALVEELTRATPPVRTVEEFVVADPAKLADTTRLSLSAIREARAIATAHYAAPLERADALLEHELRMEVGLSTGCSTVDAMMEGGIFTGEMTELFGPAGSGKTQVCLSTAINAVVASDITVMYIDTTSAFQPARVGELFSHVKHRWDALYGDDTDAFEAMGRLHCVKAHDALSLLASVRDIEARFLAEGDPVLVHCRLIIVDSMTAVISAVLGDSKHVEGHALMAEIADTLRRIARTRGVAVLITNNAVIDRERGGNAIKPALGRSWTFVPDVQVALHKFEDNVVADGKGDGTAAAAAATSAAGLPRGAELRKSPRCATPRAAKLWLATSGLKPEAEVVAVGVALPWLNAAREATAAADATTAQEGEAAGGYDAAMAGDALQAGAGDAAGVASGDASGRTAAVASARLQAAPMPT